MTTEESNKKIIPESYRRAASELVHGIPEPVRFALERLYTAGHRAYLVGGCVRDALMHRPIHDYDITTSALPEQTLEVFGDVGTVTDGLKHGTVTVIRRSYPVEITTFRVDGGYTDGRHPDEVKFARNLTDDLSRRDFTVNAMAVSYPDGELTDLFGGMEDISRRMIKCVGEPAKRFTEDALRIMRAFRFSAKLGFEIDAGTLCAAASYADRLCLISAERKATELRGIFEAADPDCALRMMRDSGVLDRVLPQTVVTDGMTAALSGEKPDFILRFGTFLRGAENMNREKAVSVLRDLKYSNKIIGSVSAVASAALPQKADAPSVRRFAAIYGDDAENIISAAAACGETVTEYSELLKKIRKDKDPLHIGDLSVNGRDVIIAGEGKLKGSAVGEILDALMEDVLDEPGHNTREYLSGMIRDIVRGKENKNAG